MPDIRHVHAQNQIQVPRQKSAEECQWTPHLSTYLPPTVGPRFTAGTEPDGRAPSELYAALVACGPHPSNGSESQH